jgi:hypothetical protein
MLGLSVLTMALAVAGDAGPTGKWEVEATPGSVLISQEGSAPWRQGTPTLVVRCRVWKESGKWGTNRDKEVYVFYRSGYPAGNADVLASLDGAAPKKHWGSPSTDGKSLFLRTSMDPFLRSLLEHETLTLVVKPDKNEALPEASFALAGLGEALKPFMEQCPLKEKKGKQ